MWYGLFFHKFGLNIQNREISPGLFIFNVPCRISPRCRSRGSLGGVEFFLTNLVDKYQRKIH